MVMRRTRIDMQKQKEADEGKTRTWSRTVLTRESDLPLLLAWAQAWHHLASSSFQPHVSCAQHHSIPRQLGRAQVLAECESDHSRSQKPGPS